MDVIKKTVASALLAMSLQGASAAEPKPYAIPRSAVVPITDSNTDWRYELYIRLPEDYGEASGTRHPVIYATDGTWHMAMLSGAAEYLLPDAILVVISWQQDAKDDFDGDERPHVSRFRDYTVVPSSDPEIQAKYNVGQARNHLSFIRDDVIAYVEVNYSTDPAHRTYFGFSLGGALGAYILFEAPDTFKNYVLGSPAFTAESLKFIQDLAAKRKADGARLNANVYVSVGEDETDAMADIEVLMSTLEGSAESGINLKTLDVIEQSGHSEAFPATAVRGLKWIAGLISAQSKRTQP